jgi:hypothetical protein
MAFKNNPGRTLRVPRSFTLDISIMGKPRVASGPRRFEKPKTWWPTEKGCIHVVVPGFNTVDGKDVLCGKSAFQYRSGFLCKGHYLQLCGLSPNAAVDTNYQRSRDIDTEIVNSILLWEGMFIAFMRHENLTYNVEASGFTIEMMDNPYPAVRPLGFDYLGEQAHG